ncbi:serine hydrolase [Nocardiopsis sp. FIRDI 009]|uniref:serine hydrolase domain-containing protein n=1 Tax=Nocardiopsis sp. FIRDI 009 TaxID=714197 RepID=UPI001E410DDD|nr:serine hydrolase domain-containing protein [Nocardiopsis sp. FIRDI 009]
MHRRVAAVSLALALTFPTPPPASAATEGMDSYVRARMAATGTPGLAYAVVGPEGIERRGVFGVDGNGDPVTEDTPFLWGSVAKPVTATAALVLAEEGRLDPDAPVEEYLPEFADFGAAPTVRDLMTQTSGITEAATVETADVYDADSAEFGPRVGRIAASEAGDPGTHEYSSANYLVLGAVIERVTGRAFGSSLREAVLDPVGMDGAFTSAAEAASAGLPPGYRSPWGVPLADADGVDDAGVSDGYLGGDLGALAAFARTQVADDPAVLDPETLAEARRGIVPVPGSRQEYGLGWRETRMSELDEPIVFHGGATPGHAAMVVVLPERDRAVVVLQNTYDLLRDGQIQAVAFGLAHLVAGGDQPRNPGPSVLDRTAVWGSTALALVMAVGAVLAVRSLRTRRGGVAAALAWSVAGAATGSAAVWPISAYGTRLALLWLPEVGLATLTAGVLGGVTLVLRMTAVARDRAASHTSSAPRNAATTRRG